MKVYPWWPGLLIRQVFHSVNIGSSRRWIESRLGLCMVLAVNSYVNSLYNGERTQARQWSRSFQTIQPLHIIKPYERNFMTSNKVVTFMNRTLEFFVFFQEYDRRQAFLSMAREAFELMTIFERLETLSVLSNCSNIHLRLLLSHCPRIKQVRRLSRFIYNYFGDFQNPSLLHRVSIDGSREVDSQGGQYQSLDWGSHQGVRLDKLQ